MKILAIEHEAAGINAADFTPQLKKAEAARAWELYQFGAIRELYFRQGQSSAVLVLECAGVEEARQILGQLPLVEAGLIAFELIPLVAYPGFERLFENRP
jgi:muconolactone delta-isomerase